MKVSVITACFNAAKTLPRTLESVWSQVLPDGTELEHIVVDGGSQDGTVEVLQAFAASKEVDNFRSDATRRRVHEGGGYTFRWLSEKDRGLYDAINKGIRLATGDVVGILNADDWFDGDDVIASVVQTFGEGAVRVTGDCRVEMERCRENVAGVERVDCVYGDIRFVKVEERFGGGEKVGTDGRVEGESCRGKFEGLEGFEGEDGSKSGGRRSAVGCPSSFVGWRAGAKTVRYYSAKRWRPWMFQWGKMPPHPGVYIRRECFEKYGDYKLGYKIAADYELLVRFLRKHAIRAKYLDKCLVCMTLGGLSTKNWKSNLLLNQEIVRGNRENGYACCLPMLLPKYAFKVWEVILPRLGVGRG